MGKAFETMVKFFQEDDWPFYQFENKPGLHLEVSLDNGDFKCFANASEKDFFLFYSFCPVKCPENKRLEVAEFLTRANYDLLLGNFEMDFRDGEIRYKTSVDLEDTQFSSTIFKNLVYRNASIMDQYLPGIMMVLYGGLSPEQAITEIEDQSDNN